MSAGPSSSRSGGQSASGASRIDFSSCQRRPGRVLVYDIDGLFTGGVDPGSFEFYLNYDDCELAARLALRTWLQRHAAGPETQAGAPRDPTDSRSG